MSRRDNSVGNVGVRFRFAILLVALFLVTGFSMSLCPATAAQEPPPVAALPGSSGIRVPDRYRKANVLRVATEANYPPFEFVKDEEIQGFDRDLGDALGKELGLNMVWVNTEWAGIVPALTTDKVDVIMSGMTIDEERKRDRAFTRPYFLSGQVIARRRDKPRLKSIADLKASEGAVAVQGGTTGEKAALHAGIRDSRLKKFPGLPEALLDVRNGKAEAVIADLPALREQISKGYGEMEIVPGLIGDPENVGIAARKNDLVLVHALNEAFDRLLVNGTYARLYEKWIGQAPRAELIAGLERAKGVGTTIPDSVSAAPTAAAAESSASALAAKSSSGSALAIRPGVLAQALPILLRGAKVTLGLTVLALLIGVPLGLMLALMRLSGLSVVRSIATVYVEVVRGTPLLMQIFVLYYILGTPEVGFNLPPFGAGVAALSLNAAAYLSEVFRAGIQSIDTGQMEAARTLGMTHGQAMRFVILPQTLQRVLPPMTNEAVALLKDSSLVSVVALAELML
ncbi:MAG: ABC transporter permease subunit, partial [Armatimonadota bacterium]